MLPATFFQAALTGEELYACSPNSYLHVYPQFFGKDWASETAVNTFFSHLCSPVQLHGFSLVKKQADGSKIDRQFHWQIKA